MEISVILPAYREADNLRKILPYLKRNLDRLEVPYEVLVIDTMEPLDNAKEVCDKNNVRYVPRKNGNYYGDAIRTGFGEAKGKYIVVMDADGSHDARYIRRFYSRITKGKWNLIIGSRYCRGGSSDNNLVQKFMSWMLNFIYCIIFGLRVKDVSNSFRMYTGDMVRRLELECDNFDIVEEILIKMSVLSPELRILEVPISFHKRQFGESKRNLVQFIISYLSTIKKLWHFKKNIKKQARIK